MVPLIQKSCSILVEKLEDLAGTEKSVDIFRYMPFEATYYGLVREGHSILMCHSVKYYISGSMVPSPWRASSLLLLVASSTSRKGRKMS